MKPSGHRYFPRLAAWLRYFGSAGAAIACLLPTLHAGGPPTDITLNSTTVREGQAAGTIVGILRAEDPDAPEPHGFALVAGVGADDNSLFTVSADTLRTAAILNHAARASFSIRLRAQDGGGNGFERQLSVTVTPPAIMEAWQEYFDALPAVTNASIGQFTKETLDYFWVYQNSLDAIAAIRMDVPANTPADTATSGTASVYLSATETARIHAAKVAHALWLDRNALVPWRLADYSPEHLGGLFDKARLFNPQSGSVFYFLSVVDHSPTDAYQYALSRGLIRAGVPETIHAVLDDLRADFLHGSPSLGDPSCAYRLRFALTNYSTTRFRPARIARSGCHSSSRVLLGLLRSLNIPGYETTTGEYFLTGHSEAVFPCVGRVLPHGDHLYSASLTATPTDELMPTLRFFEDNIATPPTGGNKYRIALRHEALVGTAHPSPTMLAGVRNPSAYGYTSAVAFLQGYAGWGQGLTAEELDQAATTMLTQFNETRRLTVSTAGGQGSVLDTPTGSDRVKDSVVRLEALPVGPYTFSHWSGNVPPGMEAANPLVLSMDADRTIAASFIIRPPDVSITRAPSGETLIRFPAQLGVPYTVEYGADLDEGSWRTLTGVLRPLTSEVVTISDPAVRPRRFFRLVTLAP